MVSFVATTPAIAIVSITFLRAPAGRRGLKWTLFI
jgi:hypothetical protein